VKLLLPPAVFGMADGLTCALGAILSLSGHADLVFPTAAAVAAAECVGMAAGEWLSDSQHGLGASAVIGIATGVGGLLPAVPYAVLRGPWAVAASVLVFTVCAGLIAVVRRSERGLGRALLETYGVLAAVAVAVWLTQLAMPHGGG
jgi:VIT1/CCC1 family predicted Fe2+/Mn2+ transporter